jgi:argininosuccinate lyase
MLIPGYGVLVCNFRQLQEDKEPLFDSVETVIGILEVTAEFADNISFNPDRLAKSLPAGHLDATTLADYLVKKVGSSVATSSDRACQFYL